MKLRVLYENYGRCPVCGVESATIAGDEVACVNPDCANYNEDYKDLVNIKGVEVVGVPITIKQNVWAGPTDIRLALPSSGGGYEIVDVTYTIVKLPTEADRTKKEDPWVTFKVEHKGKEHLYHDVGGSTAELVIPRILGPDAEYGNWVAIDDKRIRLLNP